MSANTGIKTYSGHGRKRRQFILYWLREWSSWLLIVPTLLFFFFFSWQPLFQGIVLSFFRTEGFKGVEWNGVQNYIDVMQNSVFQQTLINTFVYVLWSLVIGFFVPIVVAIAINEMRHWGSAFRFSVYFPNMVPGIAAALMWMFLFNPGEGGVLNMLLGWFGLPSQEWLQNPDMTIFLIILTITWRNFGATTLLYLASLQGINSELYEAASIDGAGIWRKFRSITLPQIAPMISLMLILQVSGVFQVFNEPLVMTEGGPSNASMSLMLQSYFYAFRYFEAGHSLALGVVTFVILMLLTIVYFKLEKKWERE
ncbi:carbohydrate ABC transporter permease [Cohnella phaseoli]|uniref:Multiple sugar transport system permease protein n=1 Tax=Cohnella phaseoli TaxID=456490 RepID=A0A3D9KGB4_9BACL|nr:sugar ABC transporter permease [Cohnella phaseoli]RED85551.1 multiple sugar transport system permease protein [Cohnella phaseoli]